MSTATGTIFDSYTDPDIPGIFMSVTDNSIAEEVVESQRKILIICPTKYGDDKIMSFSKTEQLEALVGKENTFKYGLGQFYAKEFINAGATVLVKRIDDKTATYSNQILYKNGDYYGGDYAQDSFNAAFFSDVIEKDTLINPIPSTSINYNASIEAIKTETVFSLLAKGRGAGYNDLFAVYKSAEEYEKFDADQDGIVAYKFNFVNGTVYENGTEVKKKSNTVLFSLMDIDPVSKNIITHASTGANLWVNDNFEVANAYMTAKVNPKFQEEIRKYPNIDALLADKNKPYFFAESSVTASDPTLTPTQRIWYEISINDGDPRVASTFRIQRATFNINRQLRALPIFAVDNGGIIDNYIVTVNDTNATLSLNIANYTPANPATFSATYGVGQEAYLDGDKAFYVMRLEINSVSGALEFKYEPFRFLRWELYSFLMQYNMMLDGGSDTNGGSAGFVNMDGSANINAIANSIFEYIRDDKELRETIYPKHTFNYIIDWTDSVKVKDVMTRLADRIRRTMHICSCSSVRLNETGLSPDYSKDNDILCREQYLTFSSYNTMLYSSQRNKSHLDPITRLTHKLPSSFYALLDHLYVDQEYGITEPVANIEKGIIRTDNLKLSHELYSEDIEVLRKMQINCIVTDETDNYIIDQLTSYKKTSKLSLGNVVKTIQYLQILIPKKLKPFLQKKETDVAITSTVISTIQDILKPYKVSVSSKDAIFKEVTIVPKFDNNVLRIILRLTPAGTTEKIQVPIIIGE